MIRGEGAGVCRCEFNKLDFEFLGRVCASVPAIRGAAIMGFRGIFSSQKSVLDVHVPLVRVLVWYRYSYRVVHRYTGIYRFIEH